MILCKKVDRGEANGGKPFGLEMKWALSGRGSQLLETGTNTDTGISTPS